MEGARPWTGTIAVAQNTLLSTTRSRLQAQQQQDRVTDAFPFVPPMDVLDSAEFSSLFTVGPTVPSSANYTIDSLTLSTYASPTQNIAATVVNFIVTPTDASALNIVLNVPFKPVASAEEQCLVLNKTTGALVSVLDISPRFDGGYQILVQLAGQVSYSSIKIQISLRVWGLNEIQPYSPRYGSKERASGLKLVLTHASITHRMSFQRAELQMDNYVNIAALSVGSLSHAAVQGTLTTVIASLSVTPSSSGTACTWRVVVPTITRALTASEVVGQVQTFPASTNRVVYVSNGGDVLVTFTPASVSAHRISLVLNLITLPS